MKQMNAPGRKWLRRARAEYRSSMTLLPTDIEGSLEVGGLPTAHDIPMSVRSIRSKVIRKR